MQSLLQGLERSVSVGRNSDIYRGRRLYADVCALGMIDVDAEGRVHMGRGGTPDGQFWSLSYTQIRERILEAGQLPGHATA